MNVLSNSCSIFTLLHDAAEGVAIFLPCGLSAFRAEYARYRSSLVCRETDELLTVFCNPQTSQLVVAFENPKNRILSRSEARIVVEQALKKMVEYEMKNIAMTGIRFATQNHESFQERELVSWVVDWCNKSKSNFVSITFVDLRGGFSFLDEQRKNS